MLIGSKSVQLIISAVVLNNFVLEEGQSLEQYLRKQYGSVEEKKD